MSKKYNYPELERVDTEIGRYYKDSNQNLVPSVTTVLSNTSDKSNGINEWRPPFINTIRLIRSIRQNCGDTWN